MPTFFRHYFNFILFLFGLSLAAISPAVAKITIPPIPSGALEYSTLPIGKVSVNTNIATYYWPKDSSPIPLSPRIQVESRDGFPETFLYLEENTSSLSFHLPNGLVIVRDPGDTSSRLASRLMPDNQLEFYLFQPGAFLPAVNSITMEGYKKGLLKQFAKEISLNDDLDLIPSKTFKVFGSRWGQIDYSVTPEGGKTTDFAEYFVPINNRLLVIRLRGIPSFVEQRRSQIVRMLSTIQLD
tara:strand:- start:2196 stop:2915 length:720 start_codon:yes stop_codon:yes gene_type:complete